MTKIKHLRKVRNSLFAAIALATLVSCGGGGGGDSTDVATDPVPSIMPRAVVVFGDSLSDTGNLGRTVSFGDDLPAPFFANRISNGRVAVEFVAQTFQSELEPSNYLLPGQQGTNYAVAGAQAFESRNLDLAAEISAYTTNNSGSIDDQALHLIFIGGNDVIDAVGDQTDAEELLTRAVSAVGDAVQALDELRAGQIFVLNVPDIGRTPKFFGTTQQAEATDLTLRYNEAVQAAIGSLVLRNASVTLIDAFSIFNQIVADAAQLGFTNSESACYDTGEMQFVDGCDATQFDSYVFFDDIHPTARAHELIGNELAKQIVASVNR